VNNTSHFRENTGLPGLLAVSFAAAMLLFAAMPASADDALAQKAVNDTTAWVVWGKATAAAVREDKSPFGVAQRVTISPMPERAWDSGVSSSNRKIVHKGDVLLLAFWASAHSPPAGSDFIQITARIFENVAPYTNLTPERYFLIGKEWKLFYVSGIADKDYLEDKLGGSLVLGTGDQVIDFGPVYLDNYGPNYDVTSLPHN
jgi:hypothetical protein